MLKGFKRSKSTAFFKHLDKVSAASSTGQVINTFKNEILQKSINQQSGNTREIQKIIDQGRQIQTARTGYRDRAPIFIQDPIQEQILQRLTGIYNEEIKKFSSPIVHLGLLQKNAISEAFGKVPTTFLTQISALILDKLSIVYPKISSLLQPLKSTLLFSIFHNFSEHPSHSSTSADPSLIDHTRYLSFQTYHDRLLSLQSQNKELKNQLLLLQHDKAQDNASAQIIENLVQHNRKKVQQNFIRRCFEAIRVNAARKFKTMFVQMQNLDPRFGQRAVQKTLLKKYYMDWKLYKTESKLKRTNKEISYYQAKYDDLDIALAQTRNSLRLMTEENKKLVSQLNENSSRLENRNRELAKAKVIGASQKPHQVRKLLKLYFKYVFSNPFITRVRLQQNAQEVKDKSILNMRLLLRKKELLHEGGPGLNILSNMGLQQIILRWVAFMMDRASLKLAKIIDILEKEVQIREYCKMQKKRGILIGGQGEDANLDIIDDESSEGSLTSDDEGKNGSKNQEGQVTTNITLPISAPLKSLQRRRSSRQQSKLNSALNRNQTDKKYTPFSSYRKDLKLLHTFKNMIAKGGVQEMTPDNMIQGGALLAIAFAIDQSERKLMLSNIEYINKVVQAAQSAMFTGAASTKEQIGIGGEVVERRKSMNMLPFQMVAAEEGTREEVTLPEFKQILLFISDTDMAKRTQLAIEELEKVQRSKFEWYITQQELMHGNSQHFTSLLAAIFYHNSCLEKPCPKGTSILQKEVQRLSQEQVDEEVHANGLLQKKLLSVIKQKISPLIQRKIHSNLQDLTLLYEPNELQGKTNEQISQLEMISRLPLMQTKEILTRWINHILKTYHEMKNAHNLKQSYKEKFNQSKGAQQLQQTVRNETNVMTKLPRLTISAQQKLVERQKFVADIKKKPPAFKIKVIPEKESEVFQPVSDINTALTKNCFQNLLVLLSFLGPEILWDMQECDQIELQSTPKSIELIEQLVLNSNLDSKCLYILTAISRLTKKNNLITLSDLYQMQQTESQFQFDFEKILVELFLQRPYLSNLRQDSSLLEALSQIEEFYNENRIYLTDFNQETYEILQIHIDHMKNKREPITMAFAYVQDSERYYLSVKEKMMLQLILLQKPNPILQSSQKQQDLTSKLEDQLYWLNRDVLFELITLRQPFLNIHWGAKLESTIRKFMFPLSRFFQSFLDSNGQLSYFDMWRSLKQLNIRTFNVNSRELECCIISLVRIKERSQVVTKSILDGGAGQLSTMMNFDISDDIDHEQEAFRKQLRNELQNESRQGNGGKIRVKNNLMGKAARETSLEILGLKGHYYKMMFDPNDLIMIMLCAVFKVNPTEFIKDIVITNPSLKDEGLKNVNKQLMRDKIYQHVEQYVADYLPGQIFEQFLVQHLLIKGGPSAKRIPTFYLLMQKADFKAFLGHYLNTLYTIFDFYQNEYQNQYPQSVHYRYFTLQPEVAYLILQDFDAFNNDSGLNKTTFKKILCSIQKQVPDEELLKTQKTYESTYNGFFGGPQPQTTVKPSPLGIHSHPQAIKQKQSTSQPPQRGNQSLLNTSKSLQEEGFYGLNFFEFIELLYLSSQYYNPDPFLNANQKFAEFIEKVIIVNVQFKIKGRKIGESTHRDALIKAIEGQKILRGVVLDGMIN